MVHCRPKWADRLRARAFSPVLVGLLATGALLWGVVGRVEAQLPVAELSSVFPPGGQVGSTVEVQTVGANQEEAVRLVFSHQGIVAEPKMAARHEFTSGPEPVANQFEVTIGDDVLPGIYDVWIVGRFGVSNPRSFVVGKWEEVRDNGANRAIDSAQEVAWPTAVNGWAEANATDYYQIELEQGQRVLIEGWAQRIDSKMDASLAIFDSSGRELARNLDLDGYDPVLDFTAPEAGSYRIAVWDFLYEGGPSHFYRLHIHDGPRVDFVFPPAGVAGSRMQTTIFGRNLPGGRPSGHVVLDGVELEALDINLDVPSESASLDVGGFLKPTTVGLDGFPFSLGPTAPVLVGVSQFPVIREAEPNDQPEAAQIIPVPIEVAGQFYPQRDQDWFQFDMKRGETLVLDVISQRMGLDTDPFMIVERLARDGEGNVTASVVAQVDDPPNRNALIGTPFDTSTDDPSYRLTADQDATFRVMVRDQFGDGQDDPRRVYRLVIRPPQPDFRLHAVPQEIKVANANEVRLTSLALRRGGTTLLRVGVDRIDGFAEPIEVDVEGLPEGVHCETGWLGANQETLWLVLRADEDAEAWAGPIQVVGRATLGDQSLVRHARPGAVTWGSANITQDRAEFRLARELMLAVLPELIPVHLEAKTAAISELPLLETSLGGKLEIPLELARREGFAEAVKLVATNVPAEIKPADVDIPADQSAGTLNVAITNAQAKPGIYSFYLRADTKVSYRRHPEAAARAEAELQELQQQIVELNQLVEEKTAARDAAIQRLEKAKAELSRVKAEDESAAAAAAEGVEAAEKAQVAAEQELETLRGKVERASAAQEADQKRLEELQKASQAADVNIALVSTPIQLRVVKAPWSLTAAETSLQVDPGETVPVELNLERKYGFADAVAITLELPQGVTGLSAAEMNLAADQASEMLDLSAAEDATKGTHSVVVRAKGKFNEVEVEDVITLSVTVP